MRSSRFRSVVQPFEVYRTLDEHSYNLVRSFYDEVLDKMTFLNVEAPQRTYFMPNDELSTNRLHRVEIASNAIIDSRNYENYLRCTPRVLGSVLLNCLDDEMDNVKIEATPSSYFSKQVDNRLRFGFTFENDAVLASAASRAQETIRGLVNAVVESGPARLYVGSVSYYGRADYTKELLDKAGKLKFEHLGNMALGLGRVMFAGAMFEPSQTEDSGPFSY